MNGIKAAWWSKTEWALFINFLLVLMSAADGHQFVAQYPWLTMLVATSLNVIAGISRFFSNKKLTLRPRR